MADDAKREWRSTTTPSGGFISWRPGYALPLYWHTTLEADHLPYRLELDFAADENGPRCQAVQFVVLDEPISARLIRTVPIGECVEVAITSAAMRAEQRPGEIAVSWGRGGEDLAASGDVDITERMQFASQVPTRHEHGTDEHLRAVAAIYLSASEKPTQAVEDAFGPNVSRSTVGRWLAEARKRGFLPKTTRPGSVGRGGGLSNGPRDTSTTLAHLPQLR